MEPHNSKLLLYSSRSDLIKVQALSRPSNSSCLLYLLSDPVPNGVNYARFTFESRDQGWSDYEAHHDTYRHSFSWFDATIFRTSQPSELGAPTEALKPTYDQPMDCSAELESIGWSLQASTPGDTALDSRYEWPIQHNLHANTTFRKHSVTWSRKAKARAEEENGSGSGEGFISTLIPGDRIGVWARAVFPGWANSVRSAKLELAEQLDDLEEDEAEDLASSAFCAPGITEKSVLELLGREEEDPECNTVHHGVLCHGRRCRGKTDPIAGIRYKCTICPEVDFCTPCMTDLSNRHDQRHPFVKFGKQARFEHDSRLPPEEKGKATVGSKLEGQTQEAPYKGH